MTGRDNQMMKIKDEPVDGEVCVEEIELQSEIKKEIVVKKSNIKAEEPAEYLLILPVDERPIKVEEVNEDPQASKDVKRNKKKASSKASQFKCDQPACNYVVHQQSHTKPYQCDVCDKRFGNSKNMKDHRLIKHENPNAFKCHVCNKAFSSKKNLKNHLMTHEEIRVKPFKCQQCKKSFANERSLKAHKLSIHSGELFNNQFKSLTNRTIILSQIPGHSVAICVQALLQSSSKFANMSQLT